MVQMQRWPANKTEKGMLSLSIVTHNLETILMLQEKVKETIFALTKTVTEEYLFLIEKME